MTAGIHERIDVLTRCARAGLYYLVGISASATAWLLDARVSHAAALVLLGFAAAFLLMRLLRELRPDRMAIPAELRAVLRKPRSE